MSLRLETGEPATLGTVLAKAGEGTIHDVAGRPGWAAKVFHPTLADLAGKLGKVTAMVQSPPPGVTQPNGFVVLTWPLHTLSDERGPVGYVMPKIGTASAVEIHALSNPSHRSDPPPSAPQWTKRATWGHLVNVATNLCLAAEVVHRVDAVIGDFQERNILVADTTEVTLVDCDSMQFIDRAGRQFLCRVGRPEFTAPELAEVDLGIQAREKSSDLFALAVHIHLLLMAGNHPFLRGEWSGGGEQPAALALARSGFWAGGPSSPLRTHPLAPSVSFLPIEVQQMFERAFTLGARDPGARPTAVEWRGALSRIRLRSCERGAHQIPVSSIRCPWCTIDDERGMRRQRQAGGATTAARKVVPRSATGPQRGLNPSPVGGVDPLGGQGVGKVNSILTTRVILISLAVFVIVVVVMTIFIVWALLSGTSSFGGAGPPVSQRHSLIDSLHYPNIGRSIDMRPRPPRLSVLALKWQTRLSGAGKEFGATRSGLASTKAVIRLVDTAPLVESLMCRESQVHRRIRHGGHIRGQ